MDKVVGVGSGTAMYGGAAVSLWGLTASELAAIVGAIVAVIGLVVQVVYIWRKDKRAQELHRVELARLTGGTNSAK